MIAEVLKSDRRECFRDANAMSAVHAFSRDFFIFL